MFTHGTGMIGIRNSDYSFLISVNERILGLAV